MSLETYPIFIRAGAIIPTNGSICRFCQTAHGGVFGLPLTSNLIGHEKTDRITLNVYPWGQSSFTFHRPLDDGIGFEDVMVTVDESSGTISVNAPTSQSYRLRVKSFMVPSSVEGVSSTNWQYDDTNQYVLIDVSGTDFTIIINNLGGYSTITPSGGLVSNLSAASGKNYSVMPNGLTEGALQYVDRNFPITSVPGSLQNATYIKTANDDKLDTRNPFLTFDVSEPVVIYVALDDRLSQPSWMVTAGFEDSLLDLAAEGTQGLFSLYHRQFPAGTVSLGGNEGVNNSSMYTVVILPENGGGQLPVVAWEAAGQNSGGSWSNSGWSNRSFRVLLKGSAITTSGSPVQLVLRGRSSGSYTVERVSVVQREGSTLNGVESTHQPVTFGGSWDAGVTVPAGGSVTSDPIPFDVGAGQDVFLTYWVPSNQPTVYRNGGSSTSAWIITGSDQSHTIDWESLSISETRSHIYIATQLEVVPAGGGTPPSITSHPTDVTVSAPDPATFNVTATGDSPLTYQCSGSPENGHGVKSALLP